MSAEKELDLVYFCNKSFENAEDFKFDSSNEQPPVPMPSMPVLEEKPSESQKPSSKNKRRRKSPARPAKKPKPMEKFVQQQEPVSFQTEPQKTTYQHIQTEPQKSNYQHDQQLLKLHNEYLSKLKHLTTEHSPLLSELERTISGLRSKLDSACCQLCRNSPDSHPLRLMAEQCGHKFCCGFCASEYIKQSQQEKGYLCLVCKKDSKIVCCK